MQNEPNLPDDQMSVSKVLTNDYEKKSDWTLGENEPKTNPIKANSSPIKANKMTKQTQYKAKQSQFYNHKISCLMAQGFLCWAHGFFMLWIKKNFVGKMSNEKIN